MTCPVGYTHIRPSPEPYSYENAHGEVHIASKITIECEWADRITLWNWLYSEDGCALAEVPTCLVRRVVPHGRGAIAGTYASPTYAKCIMEVFYSTEGPRWVNSVYLDELIVPSEFPIYPEFGMKWSNGDDVTREEASQPAIVHGSTWSVLKARLSACPTGAMSCSGLCNSAAESCYIFPYSFASQTVLYSDPRVLAHADYANGVRYSVTYTSKINRFGWNKFWHAKTGAWEYLSLPGGGTYYPHPLG